MNSIQKSSEEPVHGELRSRMAVLWRLLKKRPAGWQAPPEEKLVQLEFGFSGALVGSPKRR